ncbi:MAG: hypothetical protein ACOH1Y_17345 [Propionicimonas sp.]
MRSFYKDSLHVWADGISLELTRLADQLRSAGLASYHKGLHPHGTVILGPSRPALGLEWQAIALAAFAGEGRTESPVHTHAETVSVMATIDEARRQVAASGQFFVPPT